jgi:hypothetical protein
MSRIEAFFWKHFLFLTVGIPAGLFFGAAIALFHASLAR